MSAGADMAVFRAGEKLFPLNRTYVIGILNVTPDSFSDGGKYSSVEAAVKRALQMEDEGADIIDIGGQSTRPGFERISPEEEWARLEKVLEAVLKVTKLAVSVDTFYPEVARKALLAGAHIINDVSGFSDEMLETVRDFDCGCVIVHPTGGKGDILAEVKAFFEERLSAAQSCGIAAERLCFDPGVGFGKNYDEDIRLISNVDKTKIDGVAYLMAASRKRVTGRACGDPPFAERLPATLAVHTAAVLSGADIVRVHDVKEAVQAARLCDEIRKNRV